jgi:hypothetical protein
MVGSDDLFDAACELGEVLFDHGKRVEMAVRAQNALQLLIQRAAIGAARGVAAHRQLKLRSRHAAAVVIVVLQNTVVHRFHCPVHSDRCELPTYSMSDQASPRATKGKGGVRVTRRLAVRMLKAENEDPKEEPAPSADSAEDVVEVAVEEVLGDEVEADRGEVEGGAVELAEVLAAAEPAVGCGRSGRDTLLGRGARNGRMP